MGSQAPTSPWRAGSRCPKAEASQITTSADNSSRELLLDLAPALVLSKAFRRAAKAGVVSLTANLALTLGKDHIRVNGVAPGTIRTQGWDDQEGGADRLQPLYPSGRVGEPDDVAAAVAFLASSDAAWITGHTLPVDGGFLTNH